MTFFDVNLALFTLGLVAVRHRVLDEPKRHVRLIARWMALGAFAWATGWLVLTHLPSTGIPGADRPLAYGFGILQDQWLCLTYIGAVVLLLAYRPEWTRRLAVFGRAGRMALTNYMLQAMVLDLLASHYGLGLKLRPYAYVVGAALLFAVEATLSTVWLTNYRFGPLEWLWRTVTYAKWQRLRREPVAVPVSARGSGGGPAGRVQYAPSHTDAREGKAARTAAPGRTAPAAEARERNSDG